MTVYQVGEDPTDPPTPAPTPEVEDAEYTELGCAQDDQNARVRYYSEREPKPEN